MTSQWRHQINGRPADVDSVAALATYNFAHFTSMQVRSGGVRGLDLHFDRLNAASLELFGQELDSARVRQALRSALDGQENASVRLTVFPGNGAAPGDAGQELFLLASVGPPLEDAAAPMRLRSVRHERYLPHLKHVATLPLIDIGRRARKDGYDDAVFIDGAGLISEGTIWNIGFFDGTTVVWPDAPQLIGITMQLVREGLRDMGVPQAVRPVRLSDLPQYRAAFTTFSIGAGRLIASIDDHSFAVDATLSRMIAEAYASRPLQPI